MARSLGWGGLRDQWELTASHSMSKPESVIAEITSLEELGRPVKSKPRPE